MEVTKATRPHQALDTRPPQLDAQGIVVGAVGSPRLGRVRRHSWRSRQSKPTQSGNAQGTAVGAVGFPLRGTHRAPFPAPSAVLTNTKRGRAGHRCRCRRQSSPLDAQGAVTGAVGGPHHHKTGTRRAPLPVSSAVPCLDAQGAVPGAVGSPHKHKTGTRRAPLQVPSAVPPFDAQGAVTGAVGSPNQHKAETHRAPLPEPSAVPPLGRAGYRYRRRRQSLPSRNGTRRAPLPVRI